MSFQSNYTSSHHITSEDLIMMLFESVTVEVAISLSLLKCISSVLLSLKMTALSLAYRNNDLTIFLNTILFSLADLLLTVIVTSSI